MSWGQRPDELGSAPSRGAGLARDHRCLPSLHAQSGKTPRGVELDAIALLDRLDRTERRPAVLRLRSVGLGAVEPEHLVRPC
jgi:hypothetical protein